MPDAMMIRGEGSAQCHEGGMRHDQGGVRAMPCSGGRDARNAGKVALQVAPRLALKLEPADLIIP